MEKQVKKGPQALTDGWDRPLPKPVCGAITVRAVSVAVWSQMIVVCVDQMGCVWVSRSKVGMMDGMDCVCEEACGVCVSVLGVIQVNVRRWG
jgi:hypothetical protein